VDQLFSLVAVEPAQGRCSRDPGIRPDEPEMATEDRHRLVDLVRGECSEERIPMFGPRSFEEVSFSWTHSISRLPAAITSLQRATSWPKAS
jgi:hypothetical protein